MESTRTRPSDQTAQPVVKYASGPLGDMRRLKEGGQATATELREFLGRMRGRSPQEVLGEVANSSLVRCTVSATLITLGLMVALTLLPWWLRGDAPAKSAKAAKAPAAAEAKPDASGSKSPETPAKTPASDSGTKSNVEKAAEKMDMIESKPADPKSNPLEKDLDKLLEIKD